MIRKIKLFFIGSYDEFKKVIWPNRKQVITHTTIVVLSIVISMIIIGAIDFGLFSLIQYLVMGKGI